MFPLRPVDGSTDRKAFTWTSVDLRVIPLRREYSITGVVNQSKTKSHISYCVTAKRRIIYMDIHEHNPICSSLIHIYLLSNICCTYRTQTWQWQNFTSHLLLCMWFSRTSGNYVGAAWNWVKSRLRLAIRGLTAPEVQIALTALCGAAWWHCQAIAVKVSLFQKHDSSFRTASI